LLSCEFNLYRYITCNDVETPEGVQAVKAAYEYTVDHVGEDVDSGPLWLDFVGFLKKSDPEHVCLVGLGCTAVEQVEFSRPIALESAW
jgi:hypothetical protein